MGPKASRLIEFNHSLEQKNTHKFNFGLVSNRFELASLIFCWSYSCNGSWTTRPVETKLRSWRNSFPTGFIKTGSCIKWRAVSGLAEAKQSVSSSLIRHQENNMGKALWTYSLWVNPQLAVMPHWTLNIHPTRATLLSHHTSLKQQVMHRHIAWKPSAVVFNACRILVLTYTSDI